MQRSHRLRRFAAVLAISMLAAACGGGDGDVEAPATGDTETETASPTETDTATATETDTEQPAAGGERVDGTLKIGTVLPQTGDLAALGPAMVEATRLAVQQINEAGGVLGNDIELVIGDSGTNEQVANNTVDQLLDDNVDAIVGAASSRVSLSIIDKVTGSETVMCSPSNTGSALTTAEEAVPGYYFRTAPPDNLQGPALANLIIGDGYSQIGIIALNDEYGQGFANQLQQAVEDAGGEVVVNVAYDPAGTEFTADVEQLLGANPGAIALISFPDTGSKILRELLARDYPPAQIYTADGMQGGDVPSLVDPNNPGVLDGMKGTAPSSQGSEQFKQAFEQFAPPDTPQIFSAHSYDCVFAIALGAALAGTDDPTVFHNEIVGATKEGEACAEWSSCMEFINSDQDIDYNGASGQLDFIDVGEPATGTYEIWQFDSSADGNITTLDSVTIEGAEQPAD